MEAHYSNATESFVASLDYRHTGRQLIALPVTFNKGQLDNLQEVRVTVEYSGHNNREASFVDLRVMPASWEYEELNSFRNPIYKESSEELTNRIGESSTYIKSLTANGDIRYDSNQRLLFERATSTLFRGNNAIETTHSIIKNLYNARGTLVRSEEFVEGEEGTSGTFIEESVVDEYGRPVKTIEYNTLDSSSKFITENKFNEDGQTIGEFSECGEHKTELLHNAKGEIEIRKNAQGDRFAYGRDFFSGEITAISLSTESGESNTTDIRHILGSTTRLTSGHNTILNEYEHKRRKRAMLLNGFKYKFYEYEDNISSRLPNIDGRDESTKVDRVVSTLAPDEPKTRSVKETLTDKRGNLRRTLIDGKIYVTNHYNADDSLNASVDAIADTITSFDYDPLTKNLTKATRTAGKNIAALEEVFRYNERGELAGRVAKGAVTQKYEYSYKNNAARNVESISLPNGLNYLPKSDLHDRFCGHTLADGENPRFGEYVYYRKVGNRTTDLISSVRYGSIKNGQYTISEGLKYTYDAKGNITEVHENGLLAVKYTYDAISRLVREDNRKLGKTYLFSYDNNGNILSKHTTKYTLKLTDEIAEFENEVGYSYASDQLIALYFGDTSQKFEYDAIGNPMLYGDEKLIWQNGRQLKSFGDTVFVYDGSGRRTRKNNIIYTYDVNGRLIVQAESSRENRLEFVYNGTDGLVGFRCNNQEYIYRKNIQGDITHLFSMGGATVAKYNYDAWGNHTVDCLDINGNLIEDKVILATHVGTLNPFRYRGHVYDVETGLYYLPERYYDSKIGRFINADSLENLEAQSEAINGLNLYSYCVNNPVNEYDPTGGLIITAIVKAIAVATKFIVKAVMKSAKIKAIAKGAKMAKMAAKAKKMGKAATKGAMIGGEIGFVSGGLEGGAGSGGFCWGSAFRGGTVGAVTGAAAGALGKGLVKPVAKGLKGKAKGMLKGGGIYAGINAGIATIKGLARYGPEAFTRGDFWLSVGLSAGAGFVGGLFSAGGVLKNVDAATAFQAGLAAIKELPLLFLRLSRGNS